MRRIRYTSSERVKIEEENIWEMLFVTNLAAENVIDVIQRGADRLNGPWRNNKVDDVCSSDWKVHMKPTSLTGSSGTFL